VREALMVGTYENPIRDCGQMTGYRKLRRVDVADYTDLVGRNGSSLYGTQPCSGMAQWSDRCLENPLSKGGILTSGEYSLSISG